MYENIRGKKILILGGNPETGLLVDEANKMGVLTFVLDPNLQAPSKRTAYHAIHMDAMNVEAVAAVVKEHQIDGVMVGVADILVPSYMRICLSLGLPCYATEKIMAAFSSKDGFIHSCKLHAVPTTPTYDIQSTDAVALEKIQYPVVVKPVDGAAGVGISICETPDELRLGLNKALECSIQKEVLIEKFMACDDMLAYYTFVNGTAYLSVLADRFTTSKQGKSSPVCIGANYKSKHLDLFNRVMHPKLVKLFDALEIKNGVLCLQFFVDGDHIYAYDPGFRLQGEGLHIPLSFANGFDHRKMLINFALTGVMYQGNFSVLNDVGLSGKYCVTVWVLLKQGLISYIEGLDHIRRHQNITFVLQRFALGDDVTKDMVGTERQVFARIYVQTDNAENMVNTVQFIHDTLKITDQAGNDMILDRFYPDYSYLN